MLKLQSEWVVVMFLSSLFFFFLEWEFLRGKIIFFTGDFFFFGGEKYIGWVLIYLLLFFYVLTLSLQVRCPRHQRSLSNQHSHRVKKKRFIIFHFFFFSSIGRIFPWSIIPVTRTWGAGRCWTCFCFRRGYRLLDKIKSGRKNSIMVCVKKTIH